MRIVFLIFQKSDLNNFSLLYVCITKKREQFYMKLNELLLALPLLALLIPTSTSESTGEMSTTTPAVELRIALDTTLTEHARNPSIFLCLINRRH